MSSDRQTLSPLARQANWLDGYAFRLRITEQGRVVSVGDGVVWIEGLPSAAMDEVLDFEDRSRGLVFHLGSERIGAIPAPPPMKTISAWVCLAKNSPNGPEIVTLSPGLSDQI